MEFDIDKWINEDLGNNESKEDIRQKSPHTNEASGENSATTLEIPSMKPVQPSKRPALVRFGDIRGLRMFGIHSDHCYINDVEEGSTGVRFPVSYSGIRAGSLPGTTETVECRGTLMVHWENIKAIFYPNDPLDDIDLPIPKVGF